MTELPAIGLAVNERIADAQLTQLLLGMEEEGVPCDVARSAELNPLVLAHEAAVASRLGIGLGVSLDYVVVTTEKLPEGRPYLAHFLGTTPENDRTIGSNAARLVKRLPLRGLAERSQ
ncbi:MAG: glycerol dehydratase reactivase beta/small subunit family protein [Propionibacteriaceae bacterium]|nr:glycerol dehydratase reactivase beta/small subunit family protein [Propionibacteriaceae bacterium]